MRSHTIYSSELNYATNVNNFRLILKLNQVKDSCQLQYVDVESDVLLQTTTDKNTMVNKGRVGKSSAMIVEDQGFQPRAKLCVRRGPFKKLLCPHSQKENLHEHALYLNVEIPR